MNSGNVITRTLYPPITPQPGDIWINPYTQTVHTYDGTQWCSIGAPIPLSKSDHFDTPIKAYERAMKIL